MDATIKHTVEQNGVFKAWETSNRLKLKRFDGLFSVEPRQSL